jgi:hypothetical protein
MLGKTVINIYTQEEVLGRTNLPTFPVAVVAIVTSAKDCM